MNTWNNWGPAAIIILGYVVGLYFQNKRLDDFKEGLYKYLGSEFKSIDQRFTTVDLHLAKLEERFGKLEDKMEHPAAKPR
jgi:hypothetical protein